MRCLVVSDVHSNLEALTAVVADAEAGGGFARVLCLGDVVGYGADPGACIALLRSHPHALVAGNHDLAAVGALSVDDFNAAARTAALWTGERLTAEERAYLLAAPLSHEEHGVTLVHGTPRAPVWEYFLPWVMSGGDVRECFRGFTTPLCLVGHSHLPFVWDESGRALEAVTPGVGRAIANPGSVGQPRDGDPRAAYGVYDTDTGALMHRRAAYDVERAQAKILAAGLPPTLAARLSVGR